MAYTKQTWATGDTITAEKLNHMEDGIAASGTSYDLVVHSYFNESTLADTLTATGLSIDEIVAKIQDDEIVNVLIYGVVVEDAANILNIASHFETNCTLTTIEEVESVELTFRSSRTTLTIRSNSGENTGTFELNAVQYTFTYDSTTKTYTCTASGGGE